MFRRNYFRDDCRGCPALELVKRQHPAAGGRTMTRLSFVASLSALVLFVAGASAENPQIKGLQNQIKELKAQKGAIKKAIEAHYDSLIRRDKLSEKELEVLRHQIHEQEESLLAHAKTEEERVAIHARYDEIRHYLSRDIHLDAAQINKL